MSILYIAPFFEKSTIAESALNYVTCLSQEYDVVCRPIGNVDYNIGQIDKFLKPKKCDYLIIHSDFYDFKYVGGFKKCIGITHFPCDLMQETTYEKYVDIMDECYHDSSFIIPKVKNIEPCVNPFNFIKKPKTDHIFRFLITGEPDFSREIIKTTRAYVEEFRYEEPVELAIKIPREYNLAKFGELLDTSIRDTRKYSTNCYPPINYNNMWHTREKLIEYYEGFDCIINTSMYNRWSRPFLDFGFMGKRRISLVDNTNKVQGLAHVHSNSMEYPRGKVSQFSTKEIQQKLRAVLSDSSLDDMSMFTPQNILNNFRKMLL